MWLVMFFLSSRRRHTRCALVTGVQTCALPIWNHNFEGLAVLGAAGLFRVYRLQRPVADLAIVADSFHTKPLMRIVQSADRYQVLGLNRHSARLFEGNRDSIDEITLAPEVPRKIGRASCRERGGQYV